QGGLDHGHVITASGCLTISDYVQVNPGRQGSLTFASVSRSLGIKDETSSSMAILKEYGDKAFNAARSPAMPKAARAAAEDRTWSLKAAANAPTREEAMQPVPEILPIISWPLFTRRVSCP